MASGTARPRADVRPDRAGPQRPRLDCSARRSGDRRARRSRPSSCPDGRWLLRVRGRHPRGGPGPGIRGAARRFDRPVLRLGGVRRRVRGDAHGPGSGSPRAQHGPLDPGRLGGRRRGADRAGARARMASPVCLPRSRDGALAAAGVAGSGCERGTGRQLPSTGCAGRSRSSAGERCSAGWRCSRWRT